MRTLHGILIDTVNNEARPITINDSIENYYKILNCNTIDIVERKIKNRHFNIVCDDEGLFSNSPKISGITSDLKSILVGNLFITGGVDENGYLTSLSEEEEKDVLDNVVYVTSNQNPKPFVVVKISY